MATETEVQKINRLSSTLEGMVTGEVFTQEQLDVWTELVFFLCPDRLNNSSTSNEQIFAAFEERLKKQWADQELRASILLIYMISVQGTVGISARQGRFQSDDLLEDAINTGAFQFIQKIVKMHKFHENHAAVELIDVFLKYFIIHCPTRIQTLFNNCEEELGKIEELTLMPTPNSDEQIARYPLHFKVLLNIITRLYGSDTSQLKRLAKQFFTSDLRHLSQFIRGAIAITSPTLYVDYIEMLESLCKTETCASFLFHHFNSNREMLYDWAGLFGTLRRYVEVFRRVLPTVQTFVREEVEPPQTMRKDDLVATMAWMRLATAISKHCPEARRFFVFGNHFNCIDTLVSAATSFMPLLLKGEVYKFLAVLASDENSVIQIWNVMIRDCVCIFGEKTGKLIGIQTEFDEIECVNRTYDCVLGFLHLVRSLFSRRYLPDSKIVTPYVFFVVKTIICQCDSRSYRNIQQMWDMLDVALDCLFQFLRRFHISASTVSRRTPQIFVLSQLLSDSDLSRALVRILTECSNNLEEMFAVMNRNEYSDDYPIVMARNKAAKSGLRLLSYAINVHSTLRASLRTSTENNSVFIAPLEAILLTPLTTCDQRSYILMLTVFLDENVTLLPHTYYIIRILRRLAAKQNSEMHDVLLRIFQLNASQMRWIFARLISINADEEDKKNGEKAAIRKMEASDQDMIPFDLEGVEIPRLRGEIAREVLELSIDIMEVAPKQPNLAYLLFGFDLSSYHLMKTIGIDVSSEKLNCLHSLVVIIETICVEKAPYSLPYSVLFGPALRLFEKFCNVSNLSSDPILRLVRNSQNVLFKLTQSPIFQAAHDDLAETERTEQDSKVSVHLATFNREIRGLILQLIAIDFTVCMNQGHMRIPSDYLNVLLVADEKNNSRAILWSLMYNSISASLEINTPSYHNFDMARVEEVLKSCIRRDLSGVEEYDVEMVHFVLNQEISSIINSDINDIKREANEILLYCVQYNAQKRLEGSCLQVLSAWVAFVNAMLFFAPLPFLDLDVQEHIFNDAFIVLKDYLETVPINKEVVSGMSSCMFTLVRRLVEFTSFKTSLDHERKIALSMILNVLFHCLTLPEYNRYTRFKMDIYGAILCLIEACNEQAAKENRASVENYLKTGSTKPQSGDASNGKVGCEGGQLHDLILKPQNDDSLESLVHRQATIVQMWTGIFGEYLESLVKVCACDIDYAPFDQKILAMTCLSEILREGRRASADAVLYVRQNGVVKLILDSLALKYKIDFMDKARDNKASLEFLKAFLSLLYRIGTCRGGIAYLTDCAVLNRITEIFEGPMKDAPKDFVELGRMYELFEVFKRTMSLKPHSV